MPFAKRWTKDSNIDIYPDEVGTYELGYNKNVINIGSGVIRERLHDKDFNFTHVRLKITNSRRRALQIERRELKNYGEEKRDLPKYNHEIPDVP